MDIDKKQATQLDRVDHLELQVLDERRTRIEAQISAELYRLGLSQDRSDVLDARKQLIARLTLEYGLTPNDTVDGRVGTITRKEAPLKAV